LPLQDADAPQSVVGSRHALPLFGVVWLCISKVSTGRFSTQNLRECVRIYAVDVLHRLEAHGLGCSAPTIQTPTHIIMIIVSTSKSVFQVHEDENCAATVVQHLILRLRKTAKLIGIKHSCGRPILSDVSGDFIGAPGIRQRPNKILHLFGQFSVTAFLVGSAE